MPEVRGYPELFILGKADRVGQFDVVESQRPPCSQFILYGVTLAGDPIGATAPADPHGYEGEIEEIPLGLALTDQTEANNWAGNLRAKRNNPYPRVTVEMAGYWRVDAVPQSYVVLTTIADDTARGIVWTSKRMLVREYRASYDALRGECVTELVLEPETSGVAGINIIFPDPDIPPSIPTPPVIPPITLPPEPTAGIWCYAISTGAIGGVGVHNYTGLALIRTKAMEILSPVWENIGAAFFGAEDLRVFRLDKINPKNKGYVLTNDGIWYSHNLQGAPPTFTKSITLSDIQTAIGDATVIIRSVADEAELGLMQTTFALEGYVGIVVYRGDNTKVWYGFTTDVTAGIGGWTFNLVDGAIDAWFNGGEPTLLISQFDTQTILLTFGNTVVPGRDTLLNRSFDGGSTWDQQIIPHEAFENIQHHVIFYSPFLDPGFAVLWAADARNEGHIFKSVTQGITGGWVQQVPDNIIDVDCNEAIQEPWGAAVADIWLTGRTTPSPLRTGIARIIAGTPTLVFETLSEAFLGDGYSIWPWDANVQHIAAHGLGALYRTEDAWATIIDFTGNAQSFGSVAGTYRYVTPLWEPI